MMIAGATLSAVFALVSMTGPSYAGGGKDLGAAVKKVADAIKSGDKDGAAKLAKDTAKGIEDIGDLMHLFKPRTKGGLGVGSKKVVTNDAKDGIEAMIRDFARGDGIAGAGKISGSLEETGYWIAAMAEISAAKGWDKDQGKKTKKNWTMWMADMKEAGIEFSKVSAAKGNTLKAVATKVNNACNNCHSVFKD
jgi:hypothetical protein